MKSNLARTAWSITTLLVLLLLPAAVLPGVAGARPQPEVDIIVSLVPTSAAQGDTGVVVVMTLVGQTPPTPPVDAPLLAVTIGTIAATTYNRDLYTQITAVFDIPGDAPTGWHDVSLTFDSPNGLITFTKVDGYEILAGSSSPLSIAKTVATPHTPVQLGDPITYTVVVTNGGDTGATGVHITDTLPTGVGGSNLDWTGAIAAGEHAAFVLAAEVTTDTAYAGRTIVNTASYSHTSGSGAASASFHIAGTSSGYAVVDSGQFKCYDNTGEITCPAAGAAFFGQDAQHLGHPPAYTDNGNGTVTDLNTGLVWQQTTDSDGDGDIDAADKFAFAQAQPYCDNLSLGGSSDWRLPTIKELYSLIDFRGTDPSGCENQTQCPNLVPFLDTDYFDFAYGDTDAGERLIDSQYASSDLYVGDSSMLFGVNFADGRIKGYGLTINGQDKTFYVQCVQVGTDYGLNDLADNGDGTITDQASGLMWAKEDGGAALNWEEALSWVQSQNAANYLGHDDWRLPNVKELQSILDYTRSPNSSGSAAIDPLFAVTAIVNEGGAVDYPMYWASTTHTAYGGSGTAGAYVAFGRALGWMQDPGDTCYTLYDVHGAGAQRSDPKSGNLSDYYLGSACSGGSAYGRGPQGDVIRIDNYVRLVRDVDVVQPIPVQIVSLSAVQTGCEVSFSAEVTGTEPIVWQWDFGAEGTSTATNPVVDFGRSGTYPYTLTVSNGGGAYSDTASATVTVTCCAPVQNAAFTWQPPTPLAGQVITFTGSASGTEPIVYAWDWGDGGSAPGPVATHVYTAASSYLVTMTATNECNEQVVRHTVTVAADCLRPDGVEYTWTPPNPLPGELVVLDVTVMTGTDPLTYTWAFGDDSTAAGNPVSHTYATTGSYQVAMTISNSCGGLTVRHAVMVGTTGPSYSTYLPILFKTGDFTPTPAMTIGVTLSDQAQRTTIAFDGLAFLTGNLGADSFFSPGKVADFWGFQFLRDNDPSGMGHNTDFLTRASLNMLYVLTHEQRLELIALAEAQVDDINQYAYNRLVLMDAFRRLLEGDLPPGTTQLDEAAVISYSAQLYQLDGAISYDRAQLMGTMVAALEADQRAYLDTMAGHGMLEGDLSYPTGASLYSEPIPMPDISSSDFLFAP